jgi:tripartite motif-containing protein 2/3/tripartite motif-containing protein 71
VGKPVASKQEGGFDRPHMVAMDKQGFLYVADTWNYRVQKFSSEGQFMGWIGLNQNTGKITDGWTMGGKPVETDQAGIPVAIAIGANDRLIVLDYMPGRLRVFSLDGKLLGSLDGFSKPYGLAVRGSTLYVADTSHGQIVKITLTEK